MERGRIPGDGGGRSLSRRLLLAFKFPNNTTLAIRIIGPLVEHHLPSGKLVFLSVTKGYLITQRLLYNPTGVSNEEHIRCTVLYLCFFYTFIHEKTLTCLGFCSPSLPPTCSQVAAQPASISCLLPELNHCNRLPAGLEYHCTILAGIRRWGQEDSTVNLTSSMIPELPFVPSDVSCDLSRPQLPHL